MFLFPRSAHEGTYKNDKQKCLVGIMHGNIMEGSHFWALKRPKNVTFKDIDLKLGTQTYQHAHLK